MHHQNQYRLFYLKQAADRFEKRKMKKKEIDQKQAKRKFFKKKSSKTESSLIPSGVKSPQVTLASCPVNELR
jgi:hypothetical protein